MTSCAFNRVTFGSLSSVSWCRAMAAIFRIDGKGSNSSLNLSEYRNQSKSQCFIASFTLETLYVLRNSVVFSGHTYNWKLFGSHFEISEKILLK